MKSAARTLIAATAIGILATGAPAAGQVVVEDAHQAAIPAAENQTADDQAAIPAAEDQTPADDHDEYESLPPQARLVEPAAPGIYGGNPGQLADIEWAIARYEAAALELPELRIYIHPHTDGCQGHPGLFDQDRSGTRIDLCTEDMFIILHELGHAWEANSISDPTREAFLEWRGLEVWNQGDTPWGERGIEIAANIIAFGLLESPLSAAEAAAAEEMLIGYTLLTGTDSPRLGSIG